MACLGGVWGVRGLEMRKLCCKWGCGVGGVWGCEVGVCGCVVVVMGGCCLNRIVAGGDNFFVIWVVI